MFTHKIMTKTILQNKINIIAIALALGTALYFSFAVITPALADFELQRELVANCVNLSFPQGVERNTLLDPDNSVVYVNWSDKGSEYSTKIPYKPQTGFQGCSQEARTLLTHVQEVYEKQVADTCADFKDIISGAKPLPEKNGRKAKIQGAIDFVSQYCK